MAIFGSPLAFIGIDIGTSSLKLVELINRRKRIELSTYAQADLANPLVDGDDDRADQAVPQVVNVLKEMMDKAGVSADVAVAALPSSIVFSTVTTMPSLPEKEMAKAVQFAARDLVPADLDDMVLGWSRLGEQPHMSTDSEGEAQAAPPASSVKSDQPIPVFLTAAPVRVIDRYLNIFKQLELKMLALEVETFPLIRALLGEAGDSALIVDIGDLATTYHIVDAGTPRVSHTVESGGHDITAAIATALGVGHKQAEAAKAKWGLSAAAPDRQRTATEMIVRKQLDKAMSLLRLYSHQQPRSIKRTVLIGGGASLIGLPDYWTKQTKLPSVIGNPWRGMSYPLELDRTLRQLAPTFGVAVGLARRGFTS